MQPVKPRKKQLFDLTLRGMPEFGLFPDEATRGAALKTFGSSVRPRDIVIGIVWCAVTMAALVFGMRYALRVLPLPIPARFQGDVTFVLAFCAQFLLIRWMHRRHAASSLRRSLVACGVPVCLDCGYSLHGLAESTARCPECGRLLDDAERAAMLSAAAPPTPPRD